MTRTNSHSRYYRRDHARGFTLVEAVIGLAILAIIMTLAAPSFASWIGSQRVRATAEALIEGMRAAHSEALKRNATVDFVLTDDDPTSATATPGTTARGWQVRSTESPAQVVRGRISADTVASVQIGSTLGSLRFSGTGRTVPTGTSLTINVTSNVPDSRALRVVVTPGGSIRSCDPAVAATDPRGC